MSWDIYLVRTETNTEPEREISEENIIKFTREEVIRELVLLAENKLKQDLNARIVDMCTGGFW